MRRPGAMLLLAAVCGSAFADWTALRSDDRIFTPYADKATIHKLGANVSMSGLYDFSRPDLTPEGKPLLSTVVLREYDCAGRRVRLLSYIDFSGHMGAGSAVSTVNRVGRWEPIVEESLDESYWKIACEEPR